LSGVYTIGLEWSVMPWNPERYDMSFPIITPPIKDMDKREEHLVLTALEFFCDFRFNTNSRMSTRYAELIQEIDQNEYVKLCKKLGGKAQHEPTI